VRIEPQPLSRQPRPPLSSLLCLFFLLALRRAPEDALRLDRVIQDETLDLFHFPESVIVADEARCSCLDRGRDLNSVRRAQMVTGAKLGPGNCRPALCVSHMVSGTTTGGGSA